MGARQIATGHYARIHYDEQHGPLSVAARGAIRKDQTYFLFGLTQQQLARTLFPLGDMTKPQVRELARDWIWPWRQGRQPGDLLCAERRLRGVHGAYLKEKGIEPAATRGRDQDNDGRALGEHAGVHHFTVGQRKGSASRRASRST